MSMSALSTDRWTKILCQKRDLFERIGSNALSLVNSRALFRDYFEAECKRLKEQSTQKLLGKLDNSFDHIDSYIRILESATLDKGEKGYIGLVWGACFAVIQSVSTNGSSQNGHRRGLDGPDGPVQLVADLNKCVPNFNGYLQHGNQPSIQEALQDVFVGHIDCCLLMVSLLTGRTLLSSITKDSDATTPRECIQDAADTFAMAKVQLESATNLISINGANSEVQTNKTSSRRSMPGSWPSNTVWQPTPDNFQINKILGVGASGHVEKVTDISKNTVYARKHMAKPKGHSWAKFRNRVLEEFWSMRRVACRHVISVDFFQEDAERAMEIYMTPVADGNLMDLLESCVDDNYPIMQIQIIYSWFGCLLKALNFVHGKKVIHKDIKPPNILVKDNIVYLADFGLSRDFEGSASQSVGPFAGTFEYQAPEFATNQPHGRATDIFSLGCVFSEMLTVIHRRDLDQFRDLRRTPVPPPLVEMYHVVFSFHKNLGQVKEWVGELRGNEKDNILIGTISGMLEVDTSKRMSTAQALSRMESQKELCCTCGL